MSTTTTNNNSYCEWEAWVRGYAFRDNVKGFGYQCCYDAMQVIKHHQTNNNSFTHNCPFQCCLDVSYEAWVGYCTSFKDYYSRKIVTVLRSDKEEDRNEKEMYMKRFNCNSQSDITNKLLTTRTGMAGNLKSKYSSDIFRRLKIFHSLVNYHSALVDADQDTEADIYIHQIAEAVGESLRDSSRELHSDFIGTRKKKTKKRRRRSTKVPRKNIKTTKVSGKVPAKKKRSENSDDDDDDDVAAIPGDDSTNDDADTESNDTDEDTDTKSNDSNSTEDEEFQNRTVAELIKRCTLLKKQLAEERAAKDAAIASADAARATADHEASLRQTIQRQASSARRETASTNRSVVEQLRTELASTSKEKSDLLVEKEKLSSLTSVLRRENHKLVEKKKEKKELVKQLRTKNNKNMKTIAYLDKTIQRDREAMENVLRDMVALKRNTDHPRKFWMSRIRSSRDLLAINTPVSTNLEDPYDALESLLSVDDFKMLFNEIADFMSEDLQKKKKEDSDAKRRAKIEKKIRKEDAENGIIHSSAFLATNPMKDRVEVRFQAAQERAEERGQRQVDRDGVSLMQPNQNDVGLISKDDVHKQNMANYRLKMSGMDQQSLRKLKLAQSRFEKAIRGIPKFLDDLQAGRYDHKFKSRRNRRIPKITIPRINWNLYCHTVWECMIACVLSAGVKDQALIKVLLVLKVFDMLEINWLLTAGEVEDRIKLLQNVMRVCGYNYHNRAYTLVAMAMFVQKHGGIPTKASEFMKCVGFALKVTALFFQECGLKNGKPVPVVDVHVFTAYIAIGLCPSFVKQPTIYDVAFDLVAWFPAEIMKDLNECIGSTRKIYSEQMKTEAEKSGFVEAIKEHFKDDDELAKMIVKIAKAKQHKPKQDDRDKIDDLEDDFGDLDNLGSDNEQD